MDRLRPRRSCALALLLALPLGGCFGTPNVPPSVGGLDPGTMPPMAADERVGVPRPNAISAAGSSGIMVQSAAEKAAERRRRNALQREIAKPPAIAQ